MITRIEHISLFNIMQQYDYIITGAGCAGLSLLRRMMRHAYFNNKKILLIDKAEKNTNDRTWCFWEMKKGFFEDIVHHTWQQIDFYSTEFSARYDLEPYEYKMIRGIDLYTTVLNEAQQHLNIDIVYADVLNVTNNNNEAIVTTATAMYSARYIFNSILDESWKKDALQKRNIHVLLQHFKGWLIETNADVFDERIATFMDFRVDQSNGATFVYVLPITKNKALVEYTLFSEKLLQQDEYDKALKNYINFTLNIKHFTIEHEEFGIIPMTNYKFSSGDENIINIGTAAGKVKGSSGYAFQFIQKHSDEIIDALVNDKNPLIKEPIAAKRFHLYDSVLLDVLQHKKVSGAKIFTDLFSKNKPQTILKFLDNETSFKEELKIMNSVSLSAFLPATFRQMF